MSTSPRPSLYFRLSVFFAAVLGVASGAHATTVLGVVGPTDIVVGSDSLMVTPRDGGFVEAGKICKIHQADHMFFATAGFLKDESGSLDVEQAVRQSRSPGEPIRTTIDRFIPVFQSAMTATLTKMLAAQGSAVRPLFVNPTFDVDIVFFGMENGASVAYGRRFAPAVGDDGAVSVSVVDMFDYDGRSQGSRIYFALGYHQEIDTYLSQHSGSDVFSSSVGAKVDELLHLEAEKHPQYVGVPISIVEVDSDGARWLTTTSLSPRIQPYRD